MASKSNRPRPLRIVGRQIDAAQYNQARLALLRLGSPLRLVLPEIDVKMFLNEQLWACVGLESHKPFAAWTAFQARQDLHRPVACKLYLYHVHAAIVSSAALECLDLALKRRLAYTGECSARVVIRGPFQPSLSRPA